MSAPYVVHYEATHHFAASPARVWDALADVEQLAYWGWLRNLTLAGDALTPGSTIDGDVLPPVPYRIRLHIAFGDCARPSRVEADVSGDLSGAARLRLVQRGHATDLHASWTLEMNQRAMRIAARMAPRLMRWGHDHVVDASAEALREYLSAKPGRGSRRRERGDSP